VVCKGFIARYTVTYSMDTVLMSSLNLKPKSSLKRPDIALYLTFSLFTFVTAIFVYVMMETALTV